MQTVRVYIATHFRILLPNWVFSGYAFRIHAYNHLLTEPRDLYLTGVIVIRAPNPIIMQSLNKIAPTLLLLAAAAGGAAAQDSDPTILGFADLGGPAAEDGGDEECTVADRSFSSVGAAEVPTEQREYEGLAWTKALEVSGEDDDRVVTSSYYLSTPPDLDLGGGNRGVCAIFFHGASESLSFSRDGADDGETEGTCSQALGTECAGALANRAWSLDIDVRASPQEQCDRLRDELADTMDDACREVSGGSWDDLTAVGKLRSPPITCAP